MMTGFRASILPPPMAFAESTNPNGVAGSEVDVAGDRGGADVEPIGVLRGEFSGGAGFDEFDPGWDFELACMQGG
jgi:hypothetical protein